MELKPCPFCGRSGEVQKEKVLCAELVRVWCPQCGAKGPNAMVCAEYSAVDRAISKWNDRPAELSDEISDFT